MRFEIVQSKEPKQSSPRFEIVQKIDRSSTAQAFEQKKPSTISPMLQYEQMVRQNIENDIKGSPIPSVNPRAGLAEINSAKSKLTSAKKKLENTKYSDFNLVERTLNKIGGLGSNESEAHEKAQKEYEKAAKKYYSMAFPTKNMAENRLDEIDTELSKLKEEKLKNTEVKVSDRGTSASKNDKKIKSLESEAADIREILYGKSGLGKHIFNNIYAGAAQFDKSISATADMTLGNVFKLFGWENNPVSETNKQFSAVLEAAQNRAAKSAKAVGDKSNVAGGVIQGVTAALPDAILAIMTGGTSAAASLGPSASGVTAITRQAISTAVKNPFYWTSFARELGTDYEEAKQNGASEEQATLYSLLTSSLNAYVEIGGDSGFAGIQSLPQELREAGTSKSKILQWVKSSLEEGNEEIIQGAIGEVASLAVYGNDISHGKSVISNVADRLKEGAMGAAVGAVLGGGQVTIDAALNAKTSQEYEKIGNSVINGGSVVNIDDIIEYSRNSIDTKVRAQAIKATPNNISDETAGELYCYVCKDISEAMQSPSEIETLNNNYSDIITNNKSDTIRSLASAQYISRLLEMNIDEDTANSMVDGAIQGSFDNQTVQASNNLEPASAFTEPDVHNPERDTTKDLIARMNGTERHSEGQSKVVYAANRLGRKVIFEDTAKTQGFKSNGYIDSEGTIHIDYDCKSPMQFVFKHELTHFAENSEQYNDFVKGIKKSKVFEEWLRSKVNSKDAPLVNMIAEYRESVIRSREMLSPITPSEADAEMIADFVGSELFTEDTSGLNAILANMDAKQHNAFVQFLLDFISYLKKRFSDSKSLTLDLSRLEDKFNRALSEATKKNTRPDIDRTDVVFADGGVRYSINKDFVKEYDNWDKKQSEKVFTIGTTSDVLKSLGVADKTITWDGSKIIKTLAKHREMTDDIIKQVPNILENPIIVMESKQSEKRIVMFGEVYAAGKPVLAVLELSPNGRNGLQLDQIKLASAYGKDNAQRFIDSSKILYLEKNKKRISTFETSTRLQLPVGGADSNNSIKQNDLSVNTKFMQNSNKYSVPTEAEDIIDRYENGEISRQDFRAQMEDLWKQAGEDYGTIPRGENAADDYAVPKKVSKNQPTRRYVRTVIETGKLSDEAAEQLGSEILLGNFSYDVISDENAQKKAEKHIANGSAERVWNNVIHGKTVSKNDVALGEKLLADAIKSNDTKQILELSAQLSETLTRAGQVVQAASMLKKMTGMGRLISSQRMVDKINEDLRLRLGEKAPLVKIDENIAGQLAISKSQNDVEIVYQDLMQNVANQVPSTWLDKWNAWRYFAMLANPRTHLRNITGNTIFVPIVRIKDFIAFGMEAAAEKAGIIDENDRSKVAVVKKEYLDFAKEDAKNQDVVKSLKGGKYNEKNQMFEKQQIFETKWLDKAVKRNGGALEAEDIFFKNIHYKHALAGYLQSRGVDLNNITEQQLRDARTYAVQEAAKATFNDESAVAAMLQKAARINKKDTIAVKIFKASLDGTLPFKKTPVNIIRRGVEYSPLGLVKTLTKGIYDVKRGNITPSEFIDGLASAATGTGIVALGMLARSIGAVSGGFDDDKDDKFKELNGEQEYSINFAGKSYTIDWAAPACIPFFLGVEAVNALSETKDFKISQVGDVMWNALEPITNLSMLSGLQNTINSCKYADSSQTFASIIEEISLSYAMQGVPSALGSTARTIDSTQRGWYVDKNSEYMDTFVQNAKNNLQSKVPGLSFMQIPKIDQWGREKSRGGVGERITENFISPGYYSEVDYDEVNKEIKKIVKSTGDKEVIPNAADKSFAVNGKTKYLTANEYVTYAKAKGQYSYEYANDFVNSKAYSTLTDGERAEVLKSLYRYANAKAKTTVSDYDITKQFKTVSKWEKDGKSVVNFYVIRHTEK